MANLLSTAPLLKCSDLTFPPNIPFSIIQICLSSMLYLVPHLHAVTVRPTTHSRPAPALLILLGLPLSIGPVPDCLPVGELIDSSERLRYALERVAFIEKS